MLYNYRKNRPSGLGHNMYAVINPWENYSIAVLFKYISCIEVTDEYITCLFEFKKQNRDNKHCFILDAKHVETNPEFKFNIYENSISESYRMYSYDVKMLFALTRDKHWIDSGPTYTFIKFKRKDIENYVDVVSGENIHYVPDDPHIKDSAKKIYICRNRKLAFKKMHELVHLDVNNHIDATMNCFNELKKETEAFITAKNEYSYECALPMAKLMKLFKKIEAMNVMFKNDDKWLSYRSHLSDELAIIKKQLSEHIEKIFKKPELF